MPQIPPLFDLLTTPASKDPISPAESAGIRVPVRSSSLESQQSASDDSSDTEARMEEVGKFPSLSLFGGLRNWFDYETSGVLSDDEVGDDVVPVPPAAVAAEAVSANASGKEPAGVPGVSEKGGQGVTAVPLEPQRPVLGADGTSANTSERGGPDSQPTAAAADGVNVDTSQTRPGAPKEQGMIGQGVTAIQSKLEPLVPTIASWAAYGLNLTIPFVSSSESKSSHKAKSSSKSKSSPDRKPSSESAPSSEPQSSSETKASSEPEPAPPTAQPETWITPLEANVSGLDPSANIAPETPAPVDAPTIDSAIAAALAWSKAWSSIAGGTIRGTHPCGHRHPFHFVKGDVVVLGGMYGSFLSHKETGARGWLSMDAILNWGAPADVQLPLDLPYGADDQYIASGIFDRVGMINVCGDLMRELTAWQECSKGEFRFHPFAYDWRREPQYASEQLERFLKKIYEENGGQKITVFHSAKTPAELEQMRIYLTYALDSSRKFRDSLTYRPDLAAQYPPFACIVGDQWPTPTRIRTTIRRLKTPATGVGVGGVASESAAVADNIAEDGPKEVQLQWPCAFKPGDGLVTEEAQKMPEGYEPYVVPTRVSHMSVMNDLGSIKKALRKLYGIEKRAGVNGEKGGGGSDGVVGTTSSETDRKCPQQQQEEVVAS
ncbi:hypothetical protein HK104_010583 [Borealophlyctis nickersoniae]|nr:hypothetical protein HK104_010583 [Borealophlyctis nickersoniae]